MPEAEFRHAQIDEPVRDFGIARTEPHRLLRIGLGLLESAKRGLGERPRVKQRRRIRIDREACIGDTNRLVRAVCASQINAFGVVRLHVIGRERDSPVGLVDDFRIEVRSVGRLRKCKKRHIGESFAGERLGVVRVGLERLVEQGERGIVAVALLLRRLRVGSPHRGPAAHGEIDGVRVC